MPLQRHEGGYYVRLAVVERPGAMARSRPAWAKRSISLEAIMQKRPAKGAPADDVVPVVLSPTRRRETSIREALALTVQTASCATTPQVIRIERT